MAVRILNPIQGTSEYTTDKRARKYVESGMAERVGHSAIRFVQCHQRESAAVDHTIRGYNKASHSGWVSVAASPDASISLKALAMPASPS